MTQDQINLALQEAPDYRDEDAYVSDLLLSAKLLEADAEPDLSQEDTLRALWRVANLPFPDLLKWLGLKNTSCSKRFAINIRTVQRWTAGERECAIYLRRMMAEVMGKIPPPTEN